MNARRIGLILLVVFLGFWLVQDPTGMAGALQNGGSAVWGMLTDLFGAVLSFVGAL